MVDSTLTTVTTRKGVTATPQSQKADPGQKKNFAGGFTFTVSDLDRAKRFLILGSSDSFYTPGVKLAKQNAKVIISLAESDQAHALIDTIVEISTAGRAAKQDPALFALAIASSHGSVASKRYALSKLAEVARTGTALFAFLTYVQQFRGWGRALSTAVAAWYTDKSVDSVAYQTAKYRQRDGWTHRDVFRKAHPRTEDTAFRALGEWILRGAVSDDLPRIVAGYEKAKAVPVADLPDVIREYGLSWEMLPTESLNEPLVWEALLDGNVPLGALLRQLPRLTSIGLIKPLGKWETEIATRLTSEEALAKARIHPLNILVALRTYAAGGSKSKGNLVWTPDQKIVDALDTAFYKSFKYTEPAGKRTLIGLDVSGSMSMGGDLLTPREITSALAMVLLATEPSTHIIGFTGGSRGYYDRSSSTDSVTELAISTKMRLDGVMKYTERLPMGATDCALPMLYALEKGLEVDTFVVMTDNETWAGRIHPHEALAKYRRETGIDARLIVLATQPTKFSIADPDDSGMLDIAGFDSAVPGLIADFSRGV